MRTFLLAMAMIFGLASYDLAVACPLPQAVEKQLEDMRTSSMLTSRIGERLKIGEHAEFSLDENLFKGLVQTEKASNGKLICVYTNAQGVVIAEVTI